MDVIRRVWRNNIRKAGRRYQSFSLVMRKTGKKRKRAWLHLCIWTRRQLRETRNDSARNAV